MMRVSVIRMAMKRLHHKGDDESTFVISVMGVLVIHVMMTASSS